jgi:hypothetical protein
VIAIDHLPKSPESKANGATGTAAKRRAVGGVAIRVTVEEQFTPGKGGSAYLTINKDRHGGLRRHCPAAAGREAVAALFRIEPGDADGPIKWSLLSPGTGDVPKGERVDPADVAALAAANPPPASVRDAQQVLRCRMDRASRAYKEWRRVTRYQETHGKPGTAGQTCDRCDQPVDRLIAGKCATCAYPAGGAPDDDDTEGDE